ncbi:putative RNA-binding protein EIF1AD [Chanos chanos]|uniref:Probable RNA-binding protein EIF1AD n=1 Tax=Chanos chanos TaxID=29144 RepID=A0A6J2WWJ3_CHACN|nr:probable RNA-binding protein EIF1AD [Chanos chanos]
MSQATKRKHVVKEVLEDYVTPTEKQQIMKILGCPGNNLHEAVTDSGERFLISMPTKFRKNIWIKRGDFVIVDPIEEGDKVKGEISFILYKDHIQYLYKQGVWPKGFQANHTSDESQEQEKEKTENKEEEAESGNSDSEEDDSDLFVNTNRTKYQYSESEEETDEDENEEEEAEEEGA